MTSCYYCTDSAVTGAHFADGVIVAVCDEHLVRHKALARLESEIREADRIAAHELAASVKQDHRTNEAFARLAELNRQHRELGGQT